MGRRSRNKPIEEGSLRRIADLFVVPLLRYARVDVDSCEGPTAQGVDEHSFLEEIFHTDYVEFTSWVTVADFQMPGLWYQSGALKVQGYGNRHMVPGTQILVRHDSRNTYYDLDFTAGQGGRNQVFYLNTQEWYRVRKMLRRVTEEDIETKRKELHLQNERDRKSEIKRIA